MNGDGSKGMTTENMVKEEKEETTVKVAEKRRKKEELLNTFRYFDRRLDLHHHPKDINLYELLRLWVENDPKGAAVNAARKRRKRSTSSQEDEEEGEDPHVTTRRTSLPLPAPSSPSTDSTRLKKIPDAKRVSNATDYINSLDTVSAKDLLNAHKIYFKGVKKYTSVTRRRRQNRYAARLRAIHPALFSAPPPGRRQKAGLKAAAHSGDSPSRERGGTEGDGE